MNHTELRVGNFVLVENKKWHTDLEGVILVVNSVKVSSIGLERVELLEGYFTDYAQKPEYVQPIKLTIEWLLNFGFKDQTLGWFQKDDLWINTITGSTTVGDWELDKTEYVHSLQNLYFALMNKELQYSSKSCT